MTPNRPKVATRRVPCCARLEIHKMSLEAVPACRYSYERLGRQCHRFRTSHDATSTLRMPNRGGGGAHYRATSRGSELWIDDLGVSLSCSPAATMWIWIAVDYGHRCRCRYRFDIDMEDIWKTEVEVDIGADNEHASSVQRAQTAIHGF